MGSDWWKRLPADERREYERSNAISEVPLPPHEGFPKVILALVEALTAEDAAEVQRVSNVLVRGICRTLKTTRAVVRVASDRPHNAGGELHGLYEPGEDGNVARAHCPFVIAVVIHQSILMIHADLNLKKLS